MHWRKFVFYFSAICVSTVLPVVGGEPQVQFWILRAANETAAPLVEAVEGKKLPPAELASKISAWIDQKKVRELARFDQILGEETIRRQILTGELPYPDGEEKIDLGVIVEADVTLASDSRKADMRFVAEISDRKSRDAYIQKTRNYAATLFGDRWELAGLWKDAKESTLALVRIHDYQARTEGEPGVPTTAFELELWEVQPEDVEQFRKSTPATRQKAVGWLRGRAKLLAATTSQIKPGQPFSHEDAVANLEGERGGFTLQIEQMTSPDGEKIDLMLTAEWQDPEKPAIEEEYRFKVGETFSPGQTELFEPTIASKSNGPLPVLLVTPQITLPEAGPLKVATPADPAKLPEKISRATYQVAPKFKRVILGFSDQNDRPGLKDALSKRGLEFPAVASVALSVSSGEVILTHTRDGHMKFVALLKELDLLP